jgi:hypothetical protein
MRTRYRHCIMRCVAVSTLPDVVVAMATTARSSPVDATMVACARRESTARPAFGFYRELLRCHARAHERRHALR